MSGIPNRVYKGSLKHITSFLINCSYAILIYSIAKSILPIDAVSYSVTIQIAAIFALSYNAIYYINSYSDRIEDKGSKSVNIYLDRFSSLTYWFGFVATLVVSISLITNRIGIYSSISYLMVILYQVFYSLRPIRLKRFRGIRYLALGLFYTLKTNFIFSLFLVPVTLNSLILLLYIFILVTTGSMIYKARFYKKKKRIPRVGFGTFVLLVICFSILAYWWFESNWLYVVQYILAYILIALGLTGIRELILRGLMTHSKAQ